MKLMNKKHQLDGVHDLWRFRGKYRAEN